MAQAEALDPGPSQSEPLQLEAGDRRDEALSTALDDVVPEIERRGLLFRQEDEKACVKSGRSAHARGEAGRGRLALVNFLE